MDKYTNIFKNWFPYAVMVTLLCGIIYIVAQQIYRLSANDPQYQMAQDAAYYLNDGADPKLLISPFQVELTQNQGPYLIIYNNAGDVVATNAKLNNASPKLPYGVLENALKNGPQTLTWQPLAGVRMATVTIASNKGYIVAAGRSLKKTEERIAILGAQVALGWMMSLIILWFVCAIQYRLAKD